MSTGCYEIVVGTFRQTVYTFSCGGGFNADVTSLKFGSVIVELINPTREQYRKLLNKLKQLQLFKFSLFDGVDTEPICINDNASEVSSAENSAIHSKTHQGELPSTTDALKVTPKGAGKKRVRKSTSKDNATNGAKNAPSSFIKPPDNCKTEPQENSEPRENANVNAGRILERKRKRCHRRLLFVNSDHDTPNSVDDIRNGIYALSYELQSVMQQLVELDSSNGDEYSVIPAPNKVLTSCETVNMNPNRGFMDANQIEELSKVHTNVERVNIRFCTCLGSVLQALFSCEMFNCDMAWMLQNIKPEWNEHQSVWFAVSEYLSKPSRLLHKLLATVSRSNSKNELELDLLESLLSSLQTELVSRNLLTAHDDKSYIPLIGHFAFTLNRSGHCSKCNRHYRMGETTETGLKLIVSNNERLQSIEQLVCAYFNSMISSTNCTSRECRRSRISLQVQFQSLPLYLRVVIQRSGRVSLRTGNRSDSSERVNISPVLDVSGFAAKTFRNMLFIDSSNRSVVSSSRHFYKLKSVIVQLKPKEGDAIWFTYCKLRLLDPFVKYINGGSIQVSDDFLASDETHLDAPY
jgi:hypothetical protein